MVAFHNDKILQKMINDIIKNLNVTSFVETGTYGGDSTEYIAIQHPNIPVFTCEINPTFFKNNIKKLGRFPNVTSVLESSEKFVENIISNNKLGDLPFFFLDAHWYDFWPLIDEIKSISSLPKFIIVPDDFAVPNSPQFANSSGGGGTIGTHRTKVDIRPCDIDLIKHVLPLKYEIGYPKYDWKDVPEASHLCGHAFIVGGQIDIEKIKDNSFYYWTKVG